MTKKELINAINASKARSARLIAELIKAELRKEED